MPEQDSVHTKDEIRHRYEEALASFVSKVKQDRYIVAAILYGSLAYDEVWEKSDIDIMLFFRDDRTSNKLFSLVEHGITIHVEMGARSQFRAMIERSLQGDFTHSVISRSTLLFSTDESIQEYYNNASYVGNRDREMQLLRAASRLLPALTKAEKWLVVKKDPTYSFLWVMFLMDSLATVEVIWHADIPGREVIQQALKYNPSFFTPLYVDLIQQAKDITTMQRAIQMIHDYLDEKRDILFKPILTYLAEAGGTRSSSEIDEYLKTRAQIFTLCYTYEWLADKGVIQKVSAPLRLTEKSHITLDEAAYYYDGGASHDAN